MQQRARTRSPSPSPWLMATGPGASAERGPSPDRSNQARAQGLPGNGARTRGPFGADWLNGALGAAFGMDLDGIEVRFGQEAATAAVGGEAMTRGREISVGGGLREDGRDPHAMDVLAHEVAHALAGGGSGRAPLDQPGDAGEEKAEEAGRRFADWARTGFQGPTPRLRPAAGGQAAIHRYSTNPAVLTGSPMLRRGSSGDLVKALQYVLNARGYSVGVDGIFGRQTEDALLRFQRARGLDVDGIVGPRTAAALQGGSSSSNGSTSNGSSNNGSSSNGSTSAESSGDSALLTGKPMLQQGDSGNLVKILQTLLNAKGASLGVDGSFGPNTYAAVLRFQTANGLEADGVVGPKTASALKSSSSKKIGGSNSSNGSYAGNGAYSELRDAVIAAAESHLGTRYWWGADGPAYFDCSGFVLYVLRQETGLVNWGDDTAAGIANRLPRTTNPKKGDLVFFNGGSGIEHVEFCMGNGSSTIGASGGGSRTRGNDPDAKVKYGNWNNSSRSKTWGSIQGLIDAKKKTT